jgi:hypothetical protein
VRSRSLLLVPEFSIILPAEPASYAAFLA